MMPGVLSRGRREQSRLLLAVSVVLSVLGVLLRLTGLAEALKIPAWLLFVLAVNAA